LLFYNKFLNILQTIKLHKTTVDDYRDLLFYNKFLNILQTIKLHKTTVDDYRD